ncbi:MAG TPA: glycosyltransferase [Acidimicrobiia bacterium]
MRRVAFLSLHTCPLLQPGRGWAGGMNVYIDELARALAREGIRVDVFTRQHGRSEPETVVVEKGFLLHHINAGPLREISPERTMRFLGVFTDGVLDRLEDIKDISLIHSHYWLSGWAGMRIKQATGLPAINSFHTLGKVKDRSGGDGAVSSSRYRLSTEQEVIDASDRIIVSTEREKLDLVDLYGANPVDICVAVPGVNHDLFAPGVRSAARIRLGWPDVPTVLFVGRIQSLKGPDVALEAFQGIASRIGDARLVIVGAAAGDDGEFVWENLQRRAKAADLGDRVTFADPVPHREMPDVYRGSDVVLVPSRSESFGLVAAEAQAAGIPVIAANVGGLPSVLPATSGGVLVDGWNGEEWSQALYQVLTDSNMSKKLQDAGPREAERFSWESAVERIVEIYDGVS